MNSEQFKNLVRYLLFVPLGFFGDGIKATPGTWKYRFLDWLYGNGEPEFDVWFPEDNK